ncbi:hypothetical protein CPB83DRAFT_863078 [Crepidotus variabilis]|uniref:Uncharacterized protein n=1 Tax=Crepidotus variabilis TaxID=179855 RepID=A0A9P6E6L9_9AGAR|nr:hypothetical protein CPB83DRAFT_863078 [Crepidotus variabilis]
MATISSLLRCLTKNSKSWSFIVNPNPRLWPSQKLGASIGSSVYMINFQRNIDVLQTNAEQSPYSGGVYNGIPLQTARAKSFSAEIPWVPIEHGFRQTNAYGLGLREALIDAMYRFPKYDLKTKRGIKAAIEEMEKVLTPITSAKE